MYYNIVESGKRIKDLRKKAGMTQQELADKVGLTENAISKIERGIKGTTLDGMGVIAEALKASSDYLAYGVLYINGVRIPDEKVNLKMGLINSVI